jgi:hypothetical protein
LALLEIALTEPVFVLVHAYTGEAAPAAGTPKVRVANAIAHSATLGMYGTLDLVIRFQRSAAAPLPTAFIGIRS